MSRLATEAFVRTWARTDQPVAGGVAARSWMWEPEPRTSGYGTFQPRQPARVSVAGDDDAPGGPTYATFAAVRDADPQPVGEGDSAVIIRWAIDRDGNVTPAAQWDQYGVTTVHLDEVTNHTIAQPFWKCMHATGTVWKDDDYVDGALFPDPYDATGRPVTGAYWTTVLVGGTEKDVLVQCFERR